MLLEDLCEQKCLHIHVWNGSSIEMEVMCHLCDIFAAEMSVDQGCLVGTKMGLLPLPVLPLFLEGEVFVLDGTIFLAPPTELWVF